MGESLGLRLRPVPLGRDHAIPIATFVRCGATVAALKERMRMARKPNYRFERMERQRTKAASVPYVRLGAGPRRQVLGGKSRGP